MMPLAHSCFVIPAKAGIHGLTVKFGQHSLYSWIIPTMDSRVRGNDNVSGFGGA